MGYEDARDHEVKNSLDVRITEFLATYRPGQPTIVFLPGGMGSQLMCSASSYVSGDRLQGSKFSVVWYDVGLLLGHDLDSLKIETSGHDRGEHVLVPDGEVRYVIRPYNETEEYFRSRDFNYVAFGFDWRRSIVEGAAHLGYFLDQLRERASGMHLGNPLRDLTLVAHSQGGLVLHLWLLRRFRGAPSAAAVDEWMRCAICVGTPFYGTTNHLQRYYRPEKMLEMLFGARPIAELAGSLPGPYVLMPLQGDVYRRNERDLRLPRYVVRDGSDPTQEADPYDPAQYHRYPPWVRREYLDAASGLKSTLEFPLAPAVAGRVFHIYSVANGNTLVELEWDPVNGSQYDPRDPVPMRGTRGPGDGTVPAWSGALTQIPPAQRFELTEADDHVGLMEHTETLDAILKIASSRAVPASRPRSGRKLGAVAPSRDTTEHVLEEIASSKRAGKKPPAVDQDISLRFLKEGRLC